MSSFGAFVELGLRHILDVQGYDHMLFLVALCAVYTPRRWRSVLVLVTAFTVGHSCTLALSTLRLVNVPAALIEFIIPLTILATALFNLLYRPDRTGSRFDHAGWRYGLAAGFGLVHGLGFSNYLRALLPPDAPVAAPLLAFNLGVEIGQVLFISVILLISAVLTRIFHASLREWNLFISGAVAGVALLLILS